MKRVKMVSVECSMAENSGDTVIILSSELIAEVMEHYFNEHMFKVQVKVVDLQVSNSGYAFNLAFVTHKDDSTVLKEHDLLVKKSIQKHIRGKNGKFIATEQEKE